MTSTPPDELEKQSPAWKASALAYKAERDSLRAQVKVLREGLEFIADGCLVPPDGGSPYLEDAIATAQLALAACDKLGGSGE